MVLHIPFEILLLIILAVCLVSSEENIKECESEEILYKNGDEWNSKCMKHRCELGSVQSTFNKSCCQAEDGGVYKHGEAWSNGCWINRCNDSSVNSLLATTCCAIGKHAYKNGEFWYKGVVLYTCEHGSEKIALYNKGGLGLQLPSAPEMISNDVGIITRKRRAAIKKTNCWDQEKNQEVSKSWNEGCYYKKCYRGQMTWEVDSNCCEIDGLAYPNGAAWSKKCSLFFCEAGAFRKQKDASCCSHGGQKYPHRHEWDEEEGGCYSKVCNAGKIKRDFKKSCCKHDGEIFADGEYWQTRNHMWVCRNGEKVKFDDSEEYCKFDGKVYKTGEEWEKDCYKYTCDRSSISSKTDLDCMKKSGNECEHDFDNYDENGNFTAKQQDCTVEGNILGNGRSIVDQNKCLTYICSSGILLEAEIDNC